MKIGIVSKVAHCKVHFSALRKMGYEVVALGAKPTCIPKSIDLIVLRTASCSHGGDATARKWSRKTGLPLIVENGLSGIKRELERVQGEGMQTTVPLKQSGPKEGTLGSFSYVPPTLENLEGLNFAWTAKMSNLRYQRLSQAYGEALTLISDGGSATGDTYHTYKKWERVKKSLPKGAFAGKPIVFTFTYILCTDSGAAFPTHYTHNHLKEEYKKLTGKLLGNELTSCVSWWCGKLAENRLPAEPPPPTLIELEPKAEVKTETVEEDPANLYVLKSIHKIQERLDDLEEMLLEAMSTIGDLKASRPVNGGDLYDTLKDLKELGAKVTITVGGADET